MRILFEILFDKAFVGVFQLVILSLEALNLVAKVTKVGFYILDLRADVLELLSSRLGLRVFVLAHSLSCEDLLLQHRDFCSDLPSFLVVTILPFFQLFLPCVLAGTNLRLKLVYDPTKMLNLRSLFLHLHVFVALIHLDTLELLS